MHLLIQDMFYFILCGTLAGHKDEITVIVITYRLVARIRAELKTTIPRISPLSGNTFPNRFAETAAVKLENKGDLSFFNGEKPVCCFSYEPFTAFAIPVLLMITLLCGIEHADRWPEPPHWSPSAMIWKHTDAGETWRVYGASQTPFCVIHVLF